MYTNYAYGVQNGTAGKYGANYNLLVTGTSDYSGSTGIMIKNNITLNDGQSRRGFMMKQDSDDNAFLDFRTQAGGVKNLTFRLQDDNSPDNKYPMMVLTDDGNIVSVGTYGMIINGRIKASQYYVNQPDNRIPDKPGVYLGMDATNKGYFNINKGSGTGGFTFKTHDANGNETQTNLSLKAAGSVQIPYYQATGDTQDSETTALMAFDSNGNIVRTFKQNQRVRSIENRVTTLETNVVSNVPQKVNEIIGRLNTLKIWNTKISNINLPTPSSYPTLPVLTNGPYTDPSTVPLNDTKFGTVQETITLSSLANIPLTPGGSYRNGSMYYYCTGTGASVYRTNTDGSASTILDTNADQSYIYATGFAVSSDNLFYLIDNSYNLYVYNMQGTQISFYTASQPILSLTTDAVTGNIYALTTISNDTTGTAVYKVNWNGSAIQFVSMCTIPQWNMTLGSYSQQFAADGTYLYLLWNADSYYLLAQYYLSSGQLVRYIDLSKFIPTNSGQDYPNFITYNQGYLYIGWYISWYNSPNTSTLYRINVSNFSITSAGQYLSPVYQPNGIVFNGLVAYLSVYNQQTGDNNLIKMILPQ